MSNKERSVFPPELEAMLGLVPDAFLAQLQKALVLNGRTFSTLDPDELKAFDYVRAHAAKYGITAGVQDERSDNRSTVVVKLKGAG